MHQIHINHFVKSFASDFALLSNEMIGLANAPNKGKKRKKKQKTK